MGKTALVWAKSAAAATDEASGAESRIGTLGIHRRQWYIGFRLRKRASMGLGVASGFAGNN